MGEEEGHWGKVIARVKSNDKCHEANELKRAKDLFACDCNSDSDDDGDDDVGVGSVGEKWEK